MRASWKGPYPGPRLYGTIEVSILPNIAAQTSTTLIGGARPCRDVRHLYLMLEARKSVRR
jgi:hypothetical protein